MILKDINQIGRRKNLQENREVPFVVQEILRLLDAMLEEAEEDADIDRIVGEAVANINEDYGNSRDGDRRGYPSYGSFNMIPSASKLRGCTELLITVCLNNNTFEKRLLESLDHVSKYCKNTEEIYFITTKWNSAAFEKVGGYLELIRRLPINIVFIYIGKEGRVLMPE